MVRDSLAFFDDPVPDRVTAFNQVLTLAYIHEMWFGLSEALCEHPRVYATVGDSEQRLAAVSAGPVGDFHVGIKFVNASDCVEVLHWSQVSSGKAREWKDLWRERRYFAAVNDQWPYAVIEIGSTAEKDGDILLRLMPCETKLDEAEDAPGWYPPGFWIG